jgi:hypothetical protein
MKTTSLLTAAAVAAGLLVTASQSLAFEDCPLPVAAVQQEPDAYRSTLFDRSYFTHAPHSDQRVAQYEPEQPAYRTQGFYERSAMRYTQSTIGHGSNADRLNEVETWGRGAEIRPYGEWERPYRRGAQPIWMTDPQAYFYGTYPYPYLSENRDYIYYDNQRGYDGRHGKGYEKDRHDWKGHKNSSKHGGHNSHHDKH